jgi:hypothetical protein
LQKKFNLTEKVILNVVFEKKIFRRKLAKIAEKLATNNIGPSYSSHGASRGPFLTSPLGENFTPRGEVISWG